MSQPENIGKYRVIAKLGQGGMARVLLAAASGPAGFNKLMVVKELREELAAEPEFLTMFLDEARLAARLNHPNVVNTYEVVTEGDRHYIAMDYLDGQPLNRLIHRVGYSQMPLDVHVRILCDALEGLHYAHELADFDGTPLDVVHRDVSPHNIFVTYDGQVKLVDFGVAKAAGAAAQTQSGVFKGKIRYMAPEQAQAEDVDRRADIYSVGVMLWEALAKRSISRGQRDLVTLHLRIEDEEPPIREMAPDAPPRLLEICERAKSYVPDNRYESAEALRRDLDAWLEQDGHVGSKAIAALVSGAFEDDRAELKAVIEAQMTGTKSRRPPALPSLRELGPETPLLSLEHERATTDIGARPSDGDDSVTAKRFATEQTITPDKAAPVWWLVAAAAAVGLIGVSALLSMGTAGDAPPALSTNAGPAASIVITIEIKPPEAVLFVDGQQQPKHPYRAVSPIDSERHRIVVKAEGYETDSRWVEFKRDLSLSIALSKLPDSDERGSAGEDSVGQQQGATSRPRAASRPATKASAAPAAGDDLFKGKTRAPRSIDEDNPYQ